MGFLLFVHRKGFPSMVALACPHSVPDLSLFSFFPKKPPNSAIYCLVLPWQCQLKSLVPTGAVLAPTGVHPVLVLCGMFAPPRASSSSIPLAPGRIGSVLQSHHSWFNRYRLIYFLVVCIMLCFPAMISWAVFLLSRPDKPMKLFLRYWHCLRDF